MNLLAKYSGTSRLAMPRWLLLVAVLVLDCLLARGGARYCWPSTVTGRLYFCLHTDIRFYHGYQRDDNLSTYSWLLYCLLWTPVRFLQSWICYGMVVRRLIQDYYRIRYHSSRSNHQLLAQLDSYCRLDFNNAGCGHCSQSMSCQYLWRDRVLVCFDQDCHVYRADNTICGAVLWRLSK